MEASLWTSGSGAVGLGDLPGGRFLSIGYGVSADGSVVVGYSDSALGTDAFRWTAKGGMVGLGFRGAADDVSADGSVVVGYSDAAFGTEAFRWTESEGAVSLGFLPGGSFSSSAYAVSADGSVIVGQSDSSFSVVSEAFRWTASTGMVGLGDLPGGFSLSVASDVSADGSVIVGFGTTISGSAAFIWDADHGMRNLQDVLMSYGLGSSLRGWTLGSANAISADGRVITGTGINPLGFEEGWVARLGASVVPEPSSLLSSGLAAVCLLGYAWRQKRKRAR